jgi:hypothetical protein
MALASLPEETLPLCLAGNLVGELADLQRQRAEAGPATSIGERSPGAVLDDQIGELAERMKAATVVFKLRAMDGKKWDAHYAVMPTRAKDETDEDWLPRRFVWVAQMVALTCVDPVMTGEQVGELVDRLHGLAWDRLSNKCWVLNQGEVEAPNFASVSPQTPISGETSAPPTTQVSASANGKVVSRQKRPSTSTTAVASSAA